MVLVGCMKLGGREDEEETFGHKIVPFCPRMLEKKYTQTNCQSCTT